MVSPRRPGRGLIPPVKTGKYRPGDEDGAQPDRVHETFADFVDALLQEHA